MSDEIISADYNAGRGHTGKHALAVFLIAIALALLLMPLDGTIGRFALRFQDGGDLRLGGDLRRTLEFAQQFGDGFSSLLVLIAAWLLDPPRRRRFVDWIVAWLLTNLFVYAIKIFIGRPRPRIVFGHPMVGHDAPVQFLGPAGTYPLPRMHDGAIEYVWRHAWELGGGISSDLWSMPSSHTAAAAALAVAITRTYPRLKPLAWPLVAIVGASRIILGAHFPSDVIAGAGIGYAVAALTMDIAWASRFLAPRPAPVPHNSPQSDA